MIDTNIKGLVYATRAILPLMVENGEGHIINLGSVAGSYPYPGGNVYGGTKAFVSQFSLNLRADLVGKGINVTSVEPGLAETEFSIVRFKGDKEKASQVYQNTRSIKAEDIAETIYWVATRPKNININVTTEYEASKAAKPVSQGRSVYFPFNKGEFSGVREYYVNTDTDSNEAADTTSHVPKYLPKDVFKLAIASSDFNSLIA